MARIGILMLALAATVGSACTKEAAGEPSDPVTVQAQADSDGRLKDAVAAAPTGLATVYDAPLMTLDGDPTSLRAHEGKALLIVNVASKCGLTPQYAILEQLHRRYAERGFTVLGFPCNQFGGQEPGDSQEIKSFCSLEYNVTFPMYEKIEVNGPGRHPLYGVLTQTTDEQGYSGDIRWNFEKFVVAADGRTITRFKPNTKPDAPAIVAAIEAALPRG